MPKAAVLFISIGATPVVGYTSSACPSCADGATLIKRFALPEAATPIRSAKGWAPPRKMISVVDLKRGY